MKNSFQNKVVWITGGGSGLGRAMAIEFARQGANVAVSGRREQNLIDVVTEIEKNNSKGLPIICDVSKEEDIINAVAQIVENFRQLDVVIANAAIPMTGKIDELTKDEWKRVYDINVIGMAMPGAGEAEAEEEEKVE